MHLHIVQSIDIKDGGGLGEAALNLHKSFLKKCKNKNLQEKIGIKNNIEKNISNFNSFLITTSTKSNVDYEEGIIQGKRYGPKQFFYSPELKKIASEILKNTQWVNCHGFYVWPNMWIGNEVTKRKLNLIYHPHGFFDPWILKRSKIKKYIAKILFENNNFKNVKWWRALTHKEALQIRETIGNDVDVKVIPNGINLEEIDNILLKKTEFQRNEKSNYLKFKGSKKYLNCFIGRKYKRLLFLGRLHPKKGLENLIYAWSRVFNQFKDWELVIVGPDQNGYSKKLEGIINKNLFDSRCTIYPEVSGIKKHMLISSSEIFILPSFSEGFPMSLLEAAAHSKPIIQSTECNFDDLSKSAISWVSLPNAEDLEKILISALSSSDSDLKERGEAARTLVEKSYTWATISQQYLNQF